MINSDTNDLFDLNRALKFENLTIQDYEEIFDQIKEVMITKGNRNTLFGELDHKFKREIFAA